MTLNLSQFHGWAVEHAASHYCNGQAHYAAIESERWLVTNSKWEHPIFQYLKVLCYGCNSVILININMCAQLHVICVSMCFGIHIYINTYIFVCWWVVYLTLRSCTMYFRFMVRSTSFCGQYWAYVFLVQ